MLHGAALALIESLPRGWQLGDPAPGNRVLEARLLLAPSEPAAPAKTAAPAARPAFGAAPPLERRERYVPASELDEKPQIRTAVEPRFPADAPVREGRVVLRLHIGESGAVDDIAVVRAEPASVFEEAALEAFAQAAFTPGRKDGRAVKSALTLELLFGAALPVAQAKPPEGQLWQPLHRPRTKKETP